MNTKDTNMGQPATPEPLVTRLRKRAEIRAQIVSRKSVQEGKPDRIGALFVEAAAEIEELRKHNHKRLCGCLESDGWSLGCGLICSCRCHELETNATALRGALIDCVRMLKSIARQQDIGFQCLEAAAEALGQEVYDGL